MAVLQLNLYNVAGHHKDTQFELEEFFVFQMMAEKDSSTYQFTHIAVDILWLIWRAQVNRIGTCLVTTQSSIML